MASSYQQLKDMLGFSFEPSSNTSAPIRSIVILGENPDIDNNTVPETLWELGGTYVFPTAASTATIVSSNTNDTSNGTGARLVFIEGLDSNWNEVSEVLTLNGTNSVTGTVSFFRVNNARVVFSGSGQVNAGNITITVNAKTVRYIAAGECLDHTAVYSVPDRHHLFLLSTQAGIVRSNQTAYVTMVTKVFVASTNYIYESAVVTIDGSEFVSRSPDFGYPRVNGKSDIWYNIDYASTTNVNAALSVRGLLAHESWIPRWTR